MLHKTTTAKQLKCEPTWRTPTEAIDKAKEELKQGLDIIAVRQKWIKVTDRSKYRWTTVDEYKQDQLAADEEDVKRLEKSKKAAGRKVAKHKKGSSTSRSDS